MAATIDVALSLDVATPGRFAACLGVSPGGGTAAGRVDVRDSITAVAAGGATVAVDERWVDGTRVHVVDAPTGRLQVGYRAEVGYRAAEDGLGGVDTRDAVTLEQELRYRRPSRYCPSDRLVGLAAAEFGSLAPRDAARAVEQWLNETLTYVPGSTDSDDDALHPLLTRTGVCRDYAHLGVSMCRALGIPARYVAVYAPGLDPMDFHAVFEAAVDDVWYVFDGTRLAPRDSLVRIATGRDAADTAVLTPLGGVTDSFRTDLTVTTTGDLPVDDHSGLVRLP